MKVQPDPCPFIGSLCREVHVQTRTKTSIEWKRRCLECGREIVNVVFDAKTPPSTDARLIKHKLDLRKPADRWVATEMRNMSSSARKKHLERKRHASKERGSA